MAYDIEHLQEGLDIAIGVPLNIVFVRKVILDFSKRDSIESLFAEVCFQIGAPESVLALDGVVAPVPSAIGTVILIDFFNSGRRSVDNSKSGDNRGIDSLRLQHCFFSRQHRIPLC